MNIIYMGTPDFAVDPLRELVKNHNVKLVVTQPDRQKGRGKKFQFPPVKIEAVNSNIPVFQPESIKTPESIAYLKTMDADLFVVAAYGQLLPKSILEMPKYGCINIHASLLPKYRGASPIQQAIINGDEKTGVTIMQMAKGIDTGNMLLTKEIPIHKTDNYITLQGKLSRLGAQAVIEAMKQIENGSTNPVVQDDAKSSYAPLIKKEMGNIDWGKTSFEILNLIKGLYDWISTYSYLNKKDLIKILEAEEIHLEEADLKAGKPGEVVQVLAKDGIVVKTLDGHILIKKIQAQNGKAMTVSDYLRGHEIKVNDIFERVKE